MGEREGGREGEAYGELDLEHGHGEDELEMVGHALGLVVTPATRS